MNLDNRCDASILKYVRLRNIAKFDKKTQLFRIPHLKTKNGIFIRSLLSACPSVKSIYLEIAQMFQSKINIKYSGPRSRIYKKIPALLCVPCDPGLE